MPHGIADNLDVLSMRESLLEFGDSVAGRDLSALLLMKKGIHVKAGEGLLGFASAFAAFGFGWYCVYIAF